MPWTALMIVLVLVSTALRIAYLGWFCPLDLAPDEAHYWDWSRNLDWSYYSKGPLVAWLIRLSSELAGPLSVSWTGSEMLAVRLPAVFSGSLLLVGIYALTRQTLSSPRLAFLVVLGLVAQPAIVAGSMLMTIDSPFVCLWTWSLVTGYRAVFRDSRWAWPATGLLVGLGILAKYTMGLWLVSLMFFLVFTPAFRPLLLRSGFWAMVGVAFLCCLPILWWNSQHDWVTFRHVAVQAGLPANAPSTGFRWFGPLEYVAGQFAMLLGFGFIAWLGAMIRFRPTRETDPVFRYLWWMSAPTFLIFGVAAFRSSGQLNWPIAAYLSGIVLMAVWAMRLLQSTNVATRRSMRFGVSIACGLGIAMTAIALETRIIRPALAAAAAQLQRAKASLTGKPIADDPLLIRSVDPTCRLRGWKFLGREIDVVRRELVLQEGIDPLVAGTNWNMIGEIGFHCEDHPRVLTFGPFFDDRHSQYDLWRPNPFADAQVFADRTFVVVGANELEWRSLFAQVTHAREAIYREDGVLVASWPIWVCRGFRGHPVDGAGNDKY